MIRNKKGMEIAVSTVVGMILGALMLFAGIALLVNVLGQTEETYDQITSRMREEIENAFVSNDPIYIHRRSITPERSEDVFFGIGILNIFDDTREFRVDVSPDSVFDSGDSQVSFLLPFNPLELVPNQREVFFIVAPTSDLPRGQHAITLNISYVDVDSGEFVQYDTPKLLYVNK